MSYVDLGKDGPLVFEAPPGLQGVLLDFWQRPIPVDGDKFRGDVGLPGPDAGQGGKILLLPPDYTGQVPDAIVMPHTPEWAPLETGVLYGAGQGVVGWYLLRKREDG